MSMIGIVGGMGSYATLDIFRRILDAFPAEKEWDRPRMIIDNHCTMPSRVRAVLYNENRQLLVQNLAASIEMLTQAGADYILLGCNTSHIFLDEISYLTDTSHIIHLINECATKLSELNIYETQIVTTEGTASAHIYEDIFSDYHITCHPLAPSDFDEVRTYIEAVKQNRITESIKDEFVSYIKNIPSPNIILGCTELPVLYGLCKEKLVEKNIYDPLEFVIQTLKQKIGEN